MPLARWPLWMLLSATAVTAATFLAVQAPRPGSGPAAAALPASPAVPRTCVTRQGMCPAGPVPSGSPCGCPHPLRGSVPGHIVLLDGTSVLASTRGWPSQEAENPLAVLGQRGGP